MNVSWQYGYEDNPPVPVVTEVVDMPDGERSIVVHSLCESLRRMWAEIERLTDLINGGESGVTQGDAT